MNYVIAFFTAVSISLSTCAIAWLCQIEKQVNNDTFPIGTKFECKRISEYAMYCTTPRPSKKRRSLYES